MSQREELKHLFLLGKVYARHRALDALQERSLAPDHFLARHVTGDWDDVCAKDQEANRHALK